MSGDLDFYRGYYGIDDVVADPLDASWNVAPTDESYVVADRDGKRKLMTMRWGLVPHWADDTRTIHINARLETVASKPVFRNALLRHRCLVPADGFYEWEPAEQGRIPHWIHRADGHPMTFAGIWAARQDAATGEWAHRFSIVTTRAEGVIARIHDRMPVILTEDVWEPWLDRDLDDPHAALSLIRSVDPDQMMEHPVSSRVNSVRNNGPDLNQPFRGTLF
jgi:putative SOS response-associated peptidase YedK